VKEGRGKAIFIPKFVFSTHSVVEFSVQFRQELTTALSGREGRKEKQSQRLSACGLRRKKRTGRGKLGGKGT